MPTLAVLFEDFIYLIFREGKGGREGEKQQCGAAACTPSVGDLAHNPGMRPDWELNLQPFDSQANTQPSSHTSQG